MNVRIARRALIGALAAAAALPFLPAHAQQGFPSKPIKIVVP